MRELVIDFETRSRLDLRYTNVYKYARHPSTEALCMSIIGANGRPWLWRKGQPFPFEGRWPDYVFLSFNAEFEFLIWNEVCVKKYGWPGLPPDRIICLQGRSSYAGLPRKLDYVGPALGLGDMGKDADGHKIMLRLCKPNGGKRHGCEIVGGKFDETPEKHDRNEQYCLQDAVAERFVSRLCPTLPEPERQLWLAHREINERGVPVDLSMCRNAKKMAEWEMERLNQEMFDITDGKVKKPTQVMRIKKWLLENDVKLLDMREETLDWALDGKSGIKIPKKAMRVLKIRKLSRDAAIKKYDGILNHAEHDGYCRGAHVYYKAGPGRFAGAGVNFLNLRRLNEDDIDDNVKLADRISAAADPSHLFEELKATKKGAIPTLAAMVRLAICASKGKKLVVRDYKAIEMRVLHWLAGDAQTLKQIRDFDNGQGEEPYKLAAAMIYGKPVKEITKAERQTGKVMILGCGYLSGATTFSAFCENYGIDMPMDKAQELVQLYRRSYPLVKKLWYDLGRAAIAAVRHKKVAKVGLVQFYMTGYTLNCRLPSGRELKYYDATVVQGAFGEEIEALDQRSGGRKAVGLPILIENIDQAVSRDLLADALLKCHEENLPVVLHVYDEIVLEVDQDDDESGQRLTAIMRDTPAWAKGLPIDADGGESKRYTK